MEDNFVSLICNYSNKNDFFQKLNFLDAFLCDNFKKSEIIIVSDYKNDDLSKKINEQNFCNQVTVIYLENNYGINNSLKAAIDLSIGDFIIEFKTLDFNITSDMLMNLYYTCVNGNDAVIMLSKKSTLFDKTFCFILKKYGYIKFDEYNENGIITIMSRRMINRIDNIKTQMTNENLFLKMSGLKCEYVKSDLKVKNYKKGKLSDYLNNILIFTDFFTKLLFLLCIILFSCSIMFFCFSNYVLGAILMGLVIIEFSFILILKKIGLNLNYLWSINNYQYSNIEKINKDLK